MKSLSAPSRLAAPLLVALGLLASCRCGAPLEPGAGAFRVEDQRVDFGRVLEGGEATRVLRVVSERRAPLDLAATTAAPFGVEPSTAQLSGGEALDLVLRYRAGVGASRGELVLTAEGTRVVVELEGLGVRERRCVPSGACTAARFDVQTEACVEVPLPDGAACVSRDLCGVAGRCDALVCVGEARSCDDGNVCTTDSCSPGVGCLNAPVQCPAVTALCKVPRCDPARGCGEAPAPDFTPCGPVDCINRNVCIQGSCVRVDAKDGDPCAPPTPCQGEGRCLAQVCARPDAGSMTPAFSAHVPALTPRPGLDEGPVLLSHPRGLFFEACAAGAPDGGAEDCGVASFTAGGLQRFFAALPGADAPRVLGLAEDDVFVRVDGGVVALSTFDGGVRSSVAIAAPPRACAAVTALGELLLCSGEGLLAISGADAGVRLVASSGAAATKGLALDEHGTPFALLGTGELLRVVEDGGLYPIAVLDVDAGALAVSADHVLVEGTLVVSLDGGARRFVDAGEGYVAHAPHGGLVSLTRTATLHARCDGGPCGTTGGSVVLAVTALSGPEGWRAELLREGQRGRVLELWMAAADGGAALVLTGTEGEADADAGAGASARLRLFVAGQEAFDCPVPSVEPGGVVGATIEAQRLFVLQARDGGARLEGFELPGLTLERGWSERFGRGGARRAR